MTRIRRRMLKSPHPPGAERRVSVFPAVRLAELLAAKAGEHGRNLLLPSRTPGAADGADGQCGRIVGIVGQGWIRPPEDAVRVCVSADERDRAVDLICWLAGNQQECIENERSQRLAGSEQPVCVTGPASIRRLLGPEILGGSRQSPLLRASRAPSSKERGESRAGQRSH